MPCQEESDFGTYPIQIETYFYNNFWIKFNAFIIWKLDPLKLLRILVSLYLNYSFFILCFLKFYIMKLALKERKRYTFPLKR